MKKLKTTTQVMLEFDALVLEEFETGLGEMADFSAAISDAKNGGSQFFEIDESMTKSGKVEIISLLEDTKIGVTDFGSQRLYGYITKS